MATTAHAPRQEELKSKMAEETIYLCNFRVSVDGEWLCLRELTDVSLDMDMLQSPQQEDGGS